MFIKRRVKRVAIISVIAVILSVISIITNLVTSLSAKKVTAVQTEKTAAVEVKEDKPPRYDATPEELEIVARVVHTEAHGEDYTGQVLVAQCILNSAEATGKRPDDVVLQRNQYAAPAKKASESVKKAVEAVFIDGYTVTDEPIRYFYAPKYTYSEWHENSLDYVLTHGGHKFFKEN